MDRQEQYSRRNCILINGLKEEKNKSTDNRVLKLFREELNEDILLVDLDRTHRIGKTETQTADHVQFLSNFAQYNICEKVRISLKNSREKILASQKILLGTEPVF